MIKATIRVTPVDNGLQPEFGYDEGHVYTTTEREVQLPIELNDYADALNMALKSAEPALSGFGAGATYNISVEFENA